MNQPTGDIVKAERMPLTVLAQHNPIALIAAALERGIDPEKMKGMYDLVERHEKNVAAQKYGDALATFQGLCPPVLKHRKTKESAGSTFAYNFASFDDVMTQAKPHMNSCGISVSFNTEHNVEKGILTVTCRVRVGTHFEDKTFSCPVASALKISDAQKYGSALSYAKRYCLCAALNIVTTDQDDDGQGTHDYIGEDQIAEINTLLETSGKTLAPLLKWVGCASLDKMLTADFAKVITYLKGKQITPAAATELAKWTEFMNDDPNLDQLNAKLKAEFFSIADKAAKDQVWNMLLKRSADAGLTYDRAKFMFFFSEGNP